MFQVVPLNLTCTCKSLNRVCVHKMEKVCHPGVSALQSLSVSKWLVQGWLTGQHYLCNTKTARWHDTPTAYYRVAIVSSWPPAVLQHTWDQHPSPLYDDNRTRLLHPVFLPNTITIVNWGQVLFLNPEWVLHAADTDWHLCGQWSISYTQWL